VRSEKGRRELLGAAKGGGAGGTGASDSAAASPRAGGAVPGAHASRASPTAPLSETESSRTRPPAATASVAASTLAMAVTGAPTSI